MANKNAPKGLKPLNPLAQVHKYYKSASVQLGVGDPVVRTANSADPQGHTSCTRATTGSYITGVVTEVIPDSSRSYPYLKSGDTGYVMVADDPLEEFVVQDNGGATGIVITNMGQHVDAVAAIDCNSTTGISNYQLDTEAIATDNTFILRRLNQRVGNAVGAYAEWVVGVNLHTEANVGATDKLET